MHSYCYFAIIKLFRTNREKRSNRKRLNNQKSEECDDHQPHYTLHYTAIRRIKIQPQLHMAFNNEQKGSVVQMVRGMASISQLGDGRGRLWAAEPA